MNAIQKVNGMLLNEKKVFVGRFVPRKEREKELGEKAKKFTNVYIKNFGDDLTDDKLKEMFNKFGKITSYKVVSIGLCNFNSPNSLGSHWNKTNSMQLNVISLVVLSIIFLCNCQMLDECCAHCGIERVLWNFQS